MKHLCIKHPHPFPVPWVVKSVSGNSILHSTRPEVLDGMSWQGVWRLAQNVLGNFASKSVLNQISLSKLVIFLSWMWWNICGHLWTLWGMKVSIIWGMQMWCVKVPKTLLWNWILSTNLSVSWAYLPGWGVNHDQEGGSPRVRPFHCTSVGLTPAIISNVDNSTASFLLVGDCVRAIPWLIPSFMLT